MDLQRSEKILTTLEIEAARIAKLAELRVELQTLCQVMGSHSGALSDATRRLEAAAAAAVAVNDSTATALSDIRGEIKTQAREFERAFESHVARLTSQYEVLVRSESRMLAERLDLAQREQRQLTVESVDRAQKHYDDASKKLITQLTWRMLMVGGVIGVGVLIGVAAILGT